MLPINEVFETLQGEAAFTGTPSVFVRLQGCDVGCPWCDTKHTWERNANKRVGIAAMLAKEADSDHFAEVDEQDLVDEVSKFTAKHVVLTGGEPCSYDIELLVDKLLDAQRSVQIETSGTYEINVNPRAWVTVSPKINMPGGLPVLRSCIERANEIKMPVGKMADVDRLLSILKDVQLSCDVWLQPLSQSEKATKLCIAVCAERNWKVSVQTHKVIGVR